MERRKMEHVWASLDIRMCTSRNKEKGGHILLLLDKKKIKLTKEENIISIPKYDLYVCNDGTLLTYLITIVDIIHHPFI
jgi:hypothetical protein